MPQRPVLSYDVVIQTPVAEGIKQHVHFAHTDRRCLISKGKLRGVKVWKDSQGKLSSMKMCFLQNTGRVKMIWKKGIT